jgi:ABC-type transport system substrate-binding protein
VLAVLAPTVLASCADGVAEQVNYAVDGVLSSYNTNTVNGAASAGPQAFARVLTGFGLHGPDGQALADRDFGLVSVASREPMVLDYQIADNAVYSDGKPVTCDDMVLAWAAQSGRFPGFDAATWYSVLGPAGIPRDIVNKLHADFSWAGREPTVAPRMNDMGFVSVFAGPEELMEVMKGDLARWGDLMKSIKVVQ